MQKVAVLHEGMIRFVGTPKEIFATQDTVVRDFIRGSLPKEVYRYSEQDAAPSGAQEKPEESS